MPNSQMHYVLDFVTLCWERDGIMVRSSFKDAVECCEFLCCTDYHVATEEKHALCGLESTIRKPKMKHPFNNVTLHAKNVGVAAKACAAKEGPVLTLMSARRTETRPETGCIQ